MKHDIKSSISLSEAQKVFKKKYPWIVKAIDKMRTKGYHLTTKKLGCIPPHLSPTCLSFERDVNGIMTESRTIHVSASGKVEERFRNVYFTKGQLPHLLKETRKVYRKLVQFHNVAVTSPEPDAPLEIIEKPHSYPRNKLYQAYEEYKQRYKDFYDIVYSNDYIVYGIFIGCKNSSEITEYYKILEINRDMKTLAGETRRDILGEIPFKNRGRAKVPTARIQEARQRYRKNYDHYMPIYGRINNKLKQVRDRSAKKHGKRTGYRYLHLSRTDRNEIASKYKIMDEDIIKDLELYGASVYAERRVAVEMGITRSLAHAYIFSKRYNIDTAKT